MTHRQQIPNPHSSSSHASSKIKLDPLESSLLKQSELADIKGKLGHPSDFTIRLPNSGERPELIQLPSLIFWKAHIEAGVRFPISPFLVGLCQLFRVSLNQINPSSVRMAIAWYMLFRHYGGDPSSDIFHACYEIKKKSHFYYFSSRTKGPSHFLGKPPSVDGKWQRKYFVVTPKKGGWPFACGEWHYEAVSNDKARSDLISEHHHSLFQKLNKHVGVGSKNKLFKVADIVRNEKLLHYFGFFNPEVPLSPHTGIITMPL